jgi:hypothetical protein
MTWRRYYYLKRPVEQGDKTPVTHDRRPSATPETRSKPPVLPDRPSLAGGGCRVSWIALRSIQVTAFRSVPLWSGIRTELAFTSGVSPFPHL